MIIGQSLSPQHITETPAVSPLTSVALSVCLMRKYGANKHMLTKAHTQREIDIQTFYHFHMVLHILHSLLYTLDYM